MANIDLFRILVNNSTLNGAEIGAAIGVSRSTVSKWLNGQSIPRLKYIAPLAMVLKVDTEVVERIFYRTD